ncbi:cytochrome b [Methylopila henanensis]|uniref:Cytochrome b n=1 Tax=Methylopila henanensis TaxID=873516 RepID=A0ABW4K883_9HYPH
MTGSALADSSAGYGAVTRAFHGAIAALVLWQFAMVLAYRLLGEHNATLNAIYGVAPHGPVGLLVLLLVIPRAVWAFANRKRRPSYGAGPAGRLARTAHTLIYALLFLVPAVAVVRQYGKGKGWDVFGIRLFEPTGVTNDTLVAIADATHSPMSWTLLALIGGHAAAAALHGLVWKDRVVGRMFGRRAQALDAAAQ